MLTTGASALAITLLVSSSAVTSADARAAGRVAPPTDAEADEARRILEAYFATTKPAEGGRGAVRLKKPVVDGEKGIDDYIRSVANSKGDVIDTPKASKVAATQTRGEWTPTTLQTLRELQAAFARARDWDQFHTPRNILLALTGEVGELAEIFQWKGEVESGLPDFTEAEKVRSDPLCTLHRDATRLHFVYRRSTLARR